MLKAASMAWVEDVAVAAATAAVGAVKAVTAALTTGSAVLATV